MLFRLAALLFMILAVISVCYTWCKGLRMIWSHLSTFHGFAILIYHLTEVVVSCVYWNVMWELGLPNCNCLVRIIFGSLCDSPSLFYLCFFFNHCYSLVSIVSMLWAGQPMNLGFIPTRGTRFCLWGSPSLLFSG